MKEKIENIIKKYTPNELTLQIIFYLSVAIYCMSFHELWGTLFGVAFCLVSVRYEFVPAYDKLAHWYWGILYSIPALVLWIAFGWELHWLIPILPLIAGISKEKKDGELDENGKPKGNQEFLDALFTALPGILILILIFNSIYYGN